MFRYFTNPNDLNSALQSGQINMIDNLSTPQDLKLFKSNPAYRVIAGLTNGKVQMTLNNAYGPLQNKLVRQAILYATDKQAIIQAASGGYGLAAGSDTVPADPFYLNLSNTYPYNPTKAKQLLTQAGYPNGFSLSLTLPPYFYAQLATSRRAAKRRKARSRRSWASSAGSGGLAAEAGASTAPTPGPGVGYRPLARPSAPQEVYPRALAEAGTLPPMPT